MTVMTSGAYILTCALCDHVPHHAEADILAQVHASESKATRRTLSGSDGSGTNGAKNRSETTGANLAYLEGRPEDSPSRDSVSLQHKVSPWVAPWY